MPISREWRNAVLKMLTYCTFEEFRKVADKKVSHVETAIQAYPNDGNFVGNPAGSLRPYHILIRPSTEEDQLRVLVREVLYLYLADSGIALHQESLEGRAQVRRQVREATTILVNRYQTALKRILDQKRRPLS